MIGFGPGLGLLNRRRRAAAAFVGAYDAVPSIVAAYGMRRLRSAYTGSLLRMRRSSDNAESDFGYTSAGHLDTAAIVAWLSGSGYIVKWYDQSGNGYDATQSTAANQPLYVASGQNGRPVLRFDGVNDAFAISIPQALPAYVYAAVNTASLGTDWRILMNRTAATSPFGPACYVGSTGGADYRPAPYWGNYVAHGTPVQAIQLLRWRFASGVAGIRRNGGAEVTVVPTSSTLESWTAINSSTVQQSAIDCCELLLVQGATLTAGDDSSILTAANAYWGVY